jgi:predicted nucleotidyltransferase
MKRSGLPPWFERLRQELTSDAAVCLAYLFGSYAKGRQMAESDVDVGVFFYEPWDGEDRQRVWRRVEIITGLPVDLLVINDAPPLTAAAAMEGLALIVKDTYIEIETWLAVSREAMDFAEFLESFWEEREKVWGAKT